VNKQAKNTAMSLLFGRGGNSPTSVTGAPMSPKEMKAFMAEVERQMAHSPPPPVTMTKTNRHKQAADSAATATTTTLRLPTDPVVAVTREQILQQYLDLNMSATLPNGNISKIPHVKSDIYVTLRHFQFRSSPPPLACIVLNPHSKMVHACFPISNLGRSAHDIYPQVLRMLYESFIEQDLHTRYRPSTIMVDDPVLAAFMRAELHGSGTRIRVVYERHEIIATVHSDEDTSLSRACSDRMPEIRRATISFLRDTAWSTKWKVKGDEAVAAAIAADDGPDHEPLILKACASCGALQSCIRRCSGCNLQQNYCSSQCMLDGWRKHKHDCAEKVWSAIDLV